MGFDFGKALTSQQRRRRQVTSSQFSLLIEPVFPIFIIELRCYPIGLLGQDMMFGAASLIATEMVEVAVIEAMPLNGIIGYFSGMLKR